MLLEGGEFIDPGTGTVTPGGDFIVEDTPNPTGECKSQYNGKCKGECAADKYSADCQNCIAVCGGGGGQPPGKCFSVGKDRSVTCGSTSNTCTGSVGNLTCKCGSNVAGNHVKDNRPFKMGGTRTCNDCVTFCKTGAAPKVLNGTPNQPAGPGTYPKTITANCRQNSANSYVWTSGGKTSSGTSCTGARRTWCNQHTNNNCGEGGQTSTPRKTITSTLCKCGTGTAKHVTGDCNKCKNTCKSTCGNCSPQCLGTRTNVGYYFDDAAEQYFDNGFRFANMAMAI